MALLDKAEQSGAISLICGLFLTGVVLVIVALWWKFGLVSAALALGIAMIWAAAALLRRDD
jgi:preprotein translocase subunit SecD